MVDRRDWDPADEHARTREWGRDWARGSQYDPDYREFRPPYWGSGGPSGREMDRERDRNRQYGRGDWRPGRGYAGRGPKGYRRTDERIGEDVNDFLTEDAEVDATDIEVKVEDGVVILTGRVDDRRQKRVAEDLAERVSGVRDVHNQIRVQERQQHLGVGREESRPGRARRPKAS